MISFFKSAMATCTAAAVAAVISSASVAHASPVGIDLTTAGSGALLNNGAAMIQVDPQPTGTGVIHSFVRLQSPGNSTTEQGYNTDGRGAIFNSFDANNSPQFTRSLTLGQLGMHYVNHTAYRQFLLDVNEPNGGSKPLIDLTDLKLYLGASGNELKSNPNDLGTKVWDLDGGGDVTLHLKDLGHGSGQGDYLLSVPNSLFTGPNQFVYLFSKFTGAQGGFEEWAGLTSRDQPHCHGQSVPLPPAAYSGFAGLGLLAAGYGLRKRRALAV
jgi:hypothetical protein